MREIVCVCIRSYANKHARVHVCNISVCTHTCIYSCMSRKLYFCANKFSSLFSDAGQCDGSVSVFTGWSGEFSSSVNSNNEDCRWKIEVDKGKVRFPFSAASSYNCHNNNTIHTV